MSKQKYKQNIVRLKELKGIKIYFEDDFYEASSLVLRLYDGEKKFLNDSAIKRPTIHGMIKNFASLVNTCYPNTKIVKDKLKHKNFAPNATIEFDEDDCMEEQ